MGEKVEKKAKVKKSKEKNEKTKSEKRERARKSVEEDIEDIEGEDKSEEDKKPLEENIIKDEIKDLETRVQEIKVSIQNHPHDDKLSCEPNKELLEFIENQIVEKEKELECPVCLEIACSPIFMCSGYEQHLICSTCRPKLSSCPECRVVYTGDYRRHRYAEKTAEELEKLNWEWSKRFMIHY